MIKKYLFAEELAEKMNQHLNNIDEDNDNIEINEAMSYLHSASEILEGAGLKSQARLVIEAMTLALQSSNIIQKLAKKSKNKKPNNKMVKNLLDHGTMFDLNENDDYKKWSYFLDSKISPTEDISKLDDNFKKLILDDETNSLLNLDVNDADLEVYEDNFDKEIDFEDEI